MAQRTINGKDVLLMIDTTGVGTNFNVVVCLTSNGLNRSRGVETANSKCGPDSAPGEATITIPIAGFVVYDADSGKIASHSLHALWQNSSEIAWKQSTATPAEGDVIYSGKGWISELNETFDVNGKASFTATLNVSGNVSQTIQAA